MANFTRNVLNIVAATKCNSFAVGVMERFPSDLFTKSQLEEGAILLHFGAALYMFGALAYICDEYFVPALEFFVDKYNIKPHIAGATFMAIGSSSPELFTSMIGVFISKDDVGLGAIIGSAVFNILLVIGCCICVAPAGAMNLQIYPVLRDSCYYVLSLIPLAIVCWDQLVSWYDALVLVVLYAGYIFLMYMNGNFERRVIKCCPLLDNPHTDEEDDDDDNEKSPFLSNAVICQFESDQESDIFEKSHHSKNSSLDTKDDNWSSYFSFPDGTVHRFLWILGLPLIVCFAFTIPSPRQQSFKKLFPLTFIMSLAYMGLASYLLVWMVTIIGYTIGIPNIILGLVFLSAGSSIPDALGSIIVSRHGQGEMAISNCIGSNIFDILIGLGLPWLIKTTVYGTTIKIYSGNIHFTILILLGSVITLNLIFIASKWSPRWPAGLTLLVFYVGFISLACLFEMNVLGKKKLLPCTQ